MYRSARAVLGTLINLARRSSLARVFGLLGRSVSVCPIV